MMPNTPIREHDRVVLLQDADTFRVGDVGTVVHLYAGGEAFEIEFVAASGETIGLATVPSSHVRPVAPEEPLLTRALAA